jgi:hypothetical protein
MMTSSSIDSEVSQQDASSKAKSHSASRIDAESRSRVRNSAEGTDGARQIHFSDDDKGTTPAKIDSHLSNTVSNGKVNTVTFEGVTIKALIDTSLRVSDVIRQLCANAHLGVQEPPALFALRDEEDEELIDDDNMARKIAAGRNFKLCSSPTMEAVEIVDKLSSTDERSLKLATYSLQRFIREKPFADEFLSRGGLEELVKLINSLESGNTLAYALTSVQNLIESREHGWETFDSTFIRKVVAILSTHERINVCRPATAILKKLVVSGSGAADPNGGEVDTIHDAHKTRYGFDIVYKEIAQQPTFLQTLVKRLDSADTTLCMYSLSLINSLMRSATNTLFDAFAQELEQQGVSRAVARLMDSNRNDELSSSILEYQMNVIRVAHHRMHTAVTSADKRHIAALSYIWLQARISETTLETEDGGVTKCKWRRLGFENENVAKDFARTGWLGLECCENFARTDQEHFARIVQEQINRPESRRCPWGLASLEVTEILADHYGVSSGYTTATQYQPHLLVFPRIHYMALCFFLRMWSESGASKGDFARVSALVRSQVKESLRDESSRSILAVESDFRETEYRLVRDRQMRELEVEGTYENKSSIRNLRSRLYKESYEFVRQQRIQCLLEGAWFRNPASDSTYGNLANSTVRSTKGSLANGGTALTSWSKPWRFYRLSPNKRFLYFCDSYEKVPIRSGLDDLPDRIDLSLATDVSISSTTASTNATLHAPTYNNQGNNNLSFSLLRAPDVSLADFIALNASQFSEWTDGLSMLRSETGVVNTKETADFIQILTDIGVKVKLLDLTGEQVELATSVEPAPLPTSTSFFFAEL